MQNNQQLEPRGAWRAAQVVKLPLGTCTRYPYPHPQQTGRGWVYPVVRRVWEGIFVVACYYLLPKPSAPDRRRRRRRHHQSCEFVRLVLPLPRMRHRSSSNIRRYVLPIFFLFLFASTSSLSSVRPPNWFGPIFSCSLSFVLEKMPSYPSYQIH